MNNIKNYFASANTSLGFVNNFNNICSSQKKSFTFILKGGPGTGKSTLLKRVAEYFFNLGFDIEYFYCSSDPNSLDAIRIIEENISIVDGTAPHTLDANLPGIEDKIINLGIAIKDGIKNSNTSINDLLKTKQKNYIYAYQYLASAGILQKLNEDILQNEDEDFLWEEANQILKVISPQNFYKTGSERKLFDCVVEDGSIKSNHQSNNYGKTIIISKDEFVNAKILLFIKNELLNLGYAVTGFYNLLSPTTLSAIYVPLLDTYVKTTLKDDIKNSQIKQNRTSMAKLVAQASSCLNNAKAAHKKIEKFYIANMDFDIINQITKSLIIEIENIIHNKNLK